jgi:hypothetical protein
VSWGRLGNQDVQLRGSYHGVVWVYGRTQAGYLAGPFSNPPAHYFNGKGREFETVSAVAIGEIHGQTCVAAADGMRVHIYEVVRGARLPAPDVGSSRIWALGFGAIGARSLLATGSDGGGVTVWDLDTNERLTSILLDSRVTDIWFADSQLVIATSGQPLSLFSLEGLHHPEVSGVQGTCADHEHT